MALDTVLPPLLDAALPQWPSPEDLAAVCTELSRRPPLVRYGDCRVLRDRLAAVARGEGLVVQAGDCAELFAEVSGSTTARKRAQVEDLAELASRTTGLPTVAIGRIAGQFAKPRSHPLERGPRGVDLAVYRGDAVNSITPTVAGRRPEPRRLLTAYDKAAQILGHLGRGARGQGPAVFTSHEALLCDYEKALVRVDPVSGTSYGSSGHLLWVGDRTRRAAGPHVALLARVANPVAVKLGPAATPRQVEELVDLLDPDRRPGRLVLVPRLGVGGVARLLPDLVRAATSSGARPVWLCDPMHANTLRTAHGVKTRAVDDVVSEALEFVAVLRSAGAHPGGLHLEVSPDDVTECLWHRWEALGFPRLPRYRTACDPRLDPQQARYVVDAFARAAAEAPA
jgi:3-deoxy-7-phosphoheptulonate synthase